MEGFDLFLKIFWDPEFGKKFDKQFATKSKRNIFFLKVLFGSVIFAVVLAFVILKTSGQ